MTQTRTYEDGFTLIEVLVSLFIFALLSVGTMMALFQTMETQRRLNDASAELNELQQMRAIIFADMEAMVLRENRDGLGGFEPFLLTTDGEAMLTFTRRGRENPGGLSPRGDVQRVSYFFREGEFIRSSLPHENPAQIVTPTERVLMDGLRSVELSGLIEQRGQIQRIRNWRITRTATGQSVAAPTAVEFLLTYENGAVVPHLFEIGL